MIQHPSHPSRRSTGGDKKERIGVVVDTPATGLIAGVPSHRGNGFSLMELMLTVAIIIVVVGIFASLNLVGTAAESQTRIVLAMAKGIAENYETQTGEPIPHNQKNSKIPGDDEFSGTFSPIERFVYLAKQRPTTRKMLKALPKEIFIDYDGDGLEEIVDGWGNPLVYFTSNVKGTPTYESAFMEYPHTYFGSAGKDGDMGKIDKGQNTDEFQRTRDNLYSFDVE